MKRELIFGLEGPRPRAYNEFLFADQMELVVRPVQDRKAKADNEFLFAD